jgi:hypothetical protein
MYPRHAIAPRQPKTIGSPYAVWREYSRLRCSGFRSPEALLNKIRSCSVNEIKFQDIESGIGTFLKWQALPDEVDPCPKLVSLLDIADAKICEPQRDEVRNPTKARARADKAILLLCGQWFVTGAGCVRYGVIPPGISSALISSPGAPEKATSLRSVRRRSQNIPTVFNVDLAALWGPLAAGCTIQSGCGKGQSDQASEQVPGKDQKQQKQESFPNIASSVRDVRRRS